MNIINVENITKSYTGRKLFSKASFYVQEKEKIGIIGINGTGKTTLLRMIIGEEETDEGTVTLANHVVLRYLPQHPEFAPDKSSLECVLEGNVILSQKFPPLSDKLISNKKGDSLWQQMLSSMRIPKVPMQFWMQNLRRQRPTEM